MSDNDKPSQDSEYDQWLERARNGQWQKIRQSQQWNEVLFICFATAAGVFIILGILKMLGKI